MSGRRGSNSRPIAWKAIALSTELLPQKYTVRRLPIRPCSMLSHLTQAPATPTGVVVGRDGFEPPKACASRFTVCPIWPLWYLPRMIGVVVEPMEGFEPPTSWLQISCSGQLSYIGVNRFELQRYEHFFNMQIFRKLFFQKTSYALSKN